MFVTVTCGGGRADLLFDRLLLTVVGHLIDQPVHSIRLGDAVQLLLDGVVLLAGHLGIKTANVGLDPGLQIANVGLDSGRP